MIFLVVNEISETDVWQQEGGSACQVKTVFTVDCRRRLDCVRFTVG